MAKIERPFKGESLIAFLPDYTVVDIETTGMAGDLAKIIEISAIRVRNHECAADFSMLVNPHQKLSYFIQNLTGITDEMLADAEDIDYVLSAFQDFLGSDVIVGHNVHFDMRTYIHSCLYI